jgi:hypothetical protein
MSQPDTRFMKFEDRLLEHLRIALIMDMSSAATIWRGLLLLRQASALTESSLTHWTCSTLRARRW